MSECSSDCKNCDKDCAIRKETPNEFSNIKKIIGVVSGKGGVGKSTVTSLLAISMKKLGYKVAILDADITGPSIPKAFGVSEIGENGDYVIPGESKSGIKVMSLNLLMEDETEPVVWRGPILAGTVKQFFNEVNWGDIDYMFVDMPPGTGDVVLTVYQSLPLDGIVVVTTPQQLVGMIVEKSVKMACKMNVPILGIVENMSYIQCPDCGKRMNIFGDSIVENVAKKYNITTSASLPINMELPKAMDNGDIEEMEEKGLQTIVEKLEF